MSKITLNPNFGHWKLGLSLAVIAAFMWAVLPLILQKVLEDMNPETTTFFRFLIAALILTPYTILKNDAGLTKRNLSRRNIIMLLGAGLFLAGNYGFYIFGLGRISADSSQVIIQFAPMTLLIAGIYLFKEPFSQAQWYGFTAFGIGLIMFFFHRLNPSTSQSDAYVVGLIMTIVAALCWTGYAILLKILLEFFSSQQIMIALYWIGAIFFLPFANLYSLSDLDALQVVLLAFCGLNTLITYSCFSEALNHLHVSRVSAIISTTPLITIGCLQITEVSNMHYEPLTTLSLCGAVLVVSGSITTAIAKVTD